MAVANPTGGHVFTENLALSFQEIFTAIVRLRSGRQTVTDVALFRAQMREALNGAEQDARKHGYTQEEAQLAKFAVVAFLDETILNSNNPVFADWARKPLQEELFGGHTAGETFFRNIDRLLGQNDAANLADVLEAYQLCLLLGYAGRYSGGAKGELRSIRESIAEKIRRIRGVRGELSPAWRIPAEGGVAARVDRWSRPLFWTAIGCLALMLLLFVICKASLGNGISEARTLAGGLR